MFLAASFGNCLPLVGFLVPESKSLLGVKSSADKGPPPCATFSTLGTHSQASAA